MSWPHCNSATQTSARFSIRVTGQIVRQRDEAKSGEKSPENPDTPPLDGCERLPALTEQEELAFARQFTAEVANLEDKRRLELALASGKPHEAV